ncbi:hypothetical protein J3L18_31070 [Mucilaginibacter gossypii]|nr:MULTISPECIES: hypothetical protein [Mucilaginibacter]WMH62860.1 hypothetical protein J3L18_31070 [Mucilaginibacter gossypii]
MAHLLQGCILNSNNGDAILSVPFATKSLIAENLQKIIKNE